MPGSPGVDAKARVARALLWADAHHGNELVADGLSRTQRASLLQMARGTYSQAKYVSFETLLRYVRAVGLSLEEFSQLEVPDQFADSLAVVPRYERLACFAPWCPARGKPGSLKRTVTNKKLRQNGEVLRYYMRCQECSIEYAVRGDEELVERGYWISLGWARVRPLLLQGLAVKEIARRLNSTADKVVRCAAFLAARGLLPEEIMSRYGMPTRPDRVVVEKLRCLVMAGAPVGKGWRAAGETYRHWLYYLSTVEFQASTQHTTEVGVAAPV